MDMGIAGKWALSSWALSSSVEAPIDVLGLSNGARELHHGAEHPDRRRRVSGDVLMAPANRADLTPCSSTPPRSR